MTTSAEAEFRKALERIEKQDRFWTLYPYSEVLDIAGPSSLVHGLFGKIAHEVLSRHPEPKPADLSGGAEDVCERALVTTEPLLV